MKGGVSLSSPVTQPFLQGITSSTVAGYLQQSFGMQNTTLPGACSISPHIIPTGNGVDGGNDIIIQTDNKIVIGGSTGNVNDLLQVTLGYFMVARFYPTGTLDTSFGRQNGAPAGTTYIPQHIWAGAAADQGKTLAIQSDGKILLGGRTGALAAGHATNNTYLALARFNTDGSLDTSFGGQHGAPLGTTYITPSIATGAGTVSDEANSIALQSDGKIIAAGSTGSIAGNGVPGSGFMGIARFTIDGSLDTTFGGQHGAQPGTTYVSPTITGGTFDWVMAVKLQSDGKIVLGGQTTSAGGTGYFAFARLNNDGSLDTSFGGQNGAPTGTTYILPIVAGGTQDQIFTIDLQSDGKIVGAGWSTGPAPFKKYMAVVRLNIDGSLDATFGGTNGALPGTMFINTNIAGGATTVDCVNRLLIQPDGNIILTGFSAVDGGGLFHPCYFATARLTSGGTLDTTFGGFGITGPGTYTTAQPGTMFISHALSAAGSDTMIYSSALLPNGNIVSTGTAGLNFIDTNRIPQASYPFLTSLTNNYTLATYRAEYPRQGGFY